MDGREGRGLWKLAAAVLILGACGLAAWFFLRRPDGTDFVTRALAARQTALALASAEEIGGTEKEYFTGEERDSWYVPYAEYLYEKGIWDPSEIPADKEAMGKALTREEAAQMEVRLELAPPDLEEGKGSVLSAEEWKDFYGRLLEKYDAEDSVTEKELVLVGTPGTIQGAGEWEAWTDQGRFSFKGLSLDPLTDRKLLVKVKGSELLMVMEVLEEPVTYENIWLERGSGGLWRAWVCGVWREFSIPGAGDECDGVTADLTVEDGQVTKVSLKKETIKGKLLAVGDTELEIEGYGKVPLSQQFHIYRIYGEFAELDKSQLTVGYDQAEFVTAGGKICAAIIGNVVEAKNIRVLLTDANIGSVFHETAVFTSDAEFTLYYGEEGEEHYGPGETVEVTREDPRLSEGRIKIEAAEGGKIGFTSFERKYGAPWYEGTVELSLAGEGILITNEVDLETYLCYVVPSEMPESYGLEALKAQAICARSYACRQILGSAYQSYGAHVDDSTTFQVYNNTKTDDLTRQAVEETKGQVVTYGGELVTTYYYASSCGYGNDMGVWGSSREEYPYLKASYMSEGEAPDLSSEETFREWLGETDEKNLEYSAPWYRWETEISDQKLTELVDTFLSGYAKEHRDLVLFRQEDGSFQEMDGPGTIGAVQSLTVKERSASGVIYSLVAEGESGAIEVRRPGAVRALLGDPEQVYIRQDGSSSTGKSILPSATVYFEEQEGGYRIFGGGYGHGVGMSQTAASTMAGRGMDCREILAYFYPGTEVAENYGNR